MHYIITRHFPIPILLKIIYLPTIGALYFDQINHLVLTAMQLVLFHVLHLL